MKLSLTLTLLALAFPLSLASKEQCQQQYGPPPMYPPPVPPPVPPPTSPYNPPPPPPPPPTPSPTKYVPPTPPPNPYSPLHHKRELTFISYDPRCEKYGYISHRELGQQSRNLKVVDTQDLVAQHGSTCSNVEYDIYLVIQQAHFAGLGVPKDSSSSCPNLVMHSKSNRDSPLEKVAMIAGDDEVANVLDEQKLHLGSRSFESIINAFDGVEAGKNGEKFYDAITNNCVALLRNMAEPLDVKIDDRMIGFVTKRMMQESADHMFKELRESPALSALFEGGQRFLKGISKEDMLAKLIKLYV